MPSLIFALMLKHSSNDLQEWQYYEAAIKLSSMEILLCFITLGHFLLLNSSPAAEASGRCEYRLTSQVLPGSDRYCMLQVALYEAGPTVGNLTLLIKPVLSGSAVHSVVLNHRERDDRRSANTQALCCLNSYSFIGVLIIYAAQHVHLISVKKQNRASLLIEVLVRWI